MTPASMLIFVDTPKKPRQNFWILTRLSSRILVNEEQERLLRGSIAIQLTPLRLLPRSIETIIVSNSCSFQSLAEDTAHSSSCHSKLHLQERLL